MVVIAKCFLFLRAGLVATGGRRKKLHGTMPFSRIGQGIGARVCRFASTALQEPMHLNAAPGEAACALFWVFAGGGWPKPPRHAVIAQLAARRSHNPKVVSSIFTHRSVCVVRAEAVAFGPLAPYSSARVEQRNLSSKNTAQREGTHRGSLGTETSSLADQLLSNDHLAHLARVSQMHAANASATGFGGRSGDSPLV